MTNEDKYLELSLASRESFNEYKEELFKKYEVEGEKALYALALAFRNTSRLWDVESAFIELLPLFTDRNPFEELDDSED
jgi:hypothetical protein